MGLPDNGKGEDDDGNNNNNKTVINNNNNNKIDDYLSDPHVNKIYF